MKVYTLFTFLACFCFTAVNTNAQTEVDVLIELVYQDDGTVAGYPAGFNTWRIYALLPNSADLLSAVYATEDAPALSISTSTNQIWNAPLGGYLGSDINPVAFSSDPSTEYDSWVTMGAEDNTFGGFLSALSTLPTMNVIAETFGCSGTTPEIDANLNVVDGAWFTLLGNPNGVSYGADNRILIGQVTTDGDITVCMNFQVFPNGVSGDLTEYDNYCSTATLPLSIDEQVSSQAALAPNPSNGDTQLMIDATASVEAIAVHNIAGQLVMNVQPNSTAVTLPGSQLENGIYLVEVFYSDARRETLRWVVK